MLDSDPSECNRLLLLQWRYFSFVGKCCLQKKLIFFHFHYFYCLWSFIIYSADQGISETQHKIVYFPLHTFHMNQHIFVWHHWSSVFQCHQHYSSQINKRKFWCNLNQKSMLSSFPTFLLIRNNVEYQIFYFYTAEVFRCIFARCKYVAEQDFWHSFVSKYY